MTTKPRPKVTGKVIPMPHKKIKRENIHTQIAIATNSKIQVVDIAEILFLKADSNYTEIHLIDGSTIIASTTLKGYAEKLMSPSFLRVHNSYLIGRAFIKTYIPHHNKLILHNTQEIPVSRSRKNAVMNYLKTMMI